MESTEPVLDDWCMRRGAKGRPTLWRCSGCRYSFWSFGDSQDPEDDGHCSNGYWLADDRALSLLIEEIDREYWMGPIV